MRYADRMQHIRASEIRELLKLTEQPDVISFAGGLPAPDLFPTQQFADIFHDVLAHEGESYLQYGTTAGHNPLRASIATRLGKTSGVLVESENILITNGSQQGLDFAGKLFLNKGSVLLCESPTYLAAINAFKAYEPRFVPVPTDREGMIPDFLEEIIRNEPDIRLAYIIPEFQNPTGKSWSEARRRRIMEIFSRTEIPILEDNPYGELRFEGKTPPSLMSLDHKGQVIGLGTFSKILCPGLRVGWITASEELISRFDLIKQGADLHTSHLPQACIQRYLETCDLDAHIASLRTVYASRRDAMIQALDRHFPEGLTVDPPSGGLFLWAALPEGTSARRLLERCLELKVAFVPGGAFFPEGGHENTMRLNFSNMPEPRIDEGIRRMRQACLSL